MQIATTTAQNKKPYKQKGKFCFLFLPPYTLDFISIYLDFRWGQLAICRTADRENA